MNAFKQNSSPFFRNSIMKASKISLKAQNNLRENEYYLLL